MAIYGHVPGWNPCDARKVTSTSKICRTSPGPLGGCSCLRLSCWKLWLWSCRSWDENVASLVTLQSSRESTLQCHETWLFIYDLYMICPDLTPWTPHLVLGVSSQRVEMWDGPFSSKTIPSTMVGRWLLLTRLAVRMGVKHAFSFHQNYEDNLSDPIRYLGIFRISRQAARSHFDPGPFHKHSSSQMHHPDPPDFGRGCQHTSAIKGLFEGKSETLENLRPITHNFPTPNPKGLISPLPFSLHGTLGNFHHFHQVSHLISSSQASFLPALQALPAVAGRGGAGRRLFAAAAGVARLVTGAHGRQGRAEAAGGGASRAPMGGCHDWLVLWLAKG